MQCSQMHFLESGGLSFAFTCHNPASVIATTYKHGDELGLCTACFQLRVVNKDEDNFLERHSFTEVQ